jgi:hypothetical protein
MHEKHVIQKIQVKRISEMDDVIVHVNQLLLQLQFVVQVIMVKELII